MTRAAMTCSNDKRLIILRKLYSSKMLKESRGEGCAPGNESSALFLGLQGRDALLQAPPVVQLGGTADGCGQGAGRRRW